MLTIILITLAGWLISKRWVEKIEPKGMFNGLNVSFATVGAFFVSVLIAFLITVPSLNSPKMVVEKKIKLAALIGPKAGVGGYFFLGCGSINTISYYVYFYEEGGYTRFGKIKTENADIYERDYIDTGRLVIYHSTFQFRLWGLPSGERRRRYVFYIPEGSMTRNYRLDLNNF